MTTSPGLLLGKGRPWRHVAALVALLIVTTWVVESMIDGLSTQAGDPDGGFVSMLDMVPRIAPLQLLAYATGVLVVRLRGWWRPTVTAIAAAVLATWLSIEVSHHLVEVVSNMPPLWPWEYDGSSNYYLTGGETFRVVVTDVLLGGGAGLLVGWSERVRVGDREVSPEPGSGITSGGDQRRP